MARFLLRAALEPILWAILSLVLTGKLGRLRERASGLFVEREIYLRSDGRVRFVRITRRAQLRLAGAIAFLLLLWAVVTLTMLALNIVASSERDALLREQAAVARDAAEVAKFRKASGNVADDLLRRQSVIEDLVRSELGAPAEPAPKAEKPRTTAAMPDHRALAVLAERQDRFAERLASAFDARSRTAAGTLDRLGFNSTAMLKAATRAQGGPFVPAGRGVAMTPALARLAASVARWSVLRDNLTALPSGAPTDGSPVTSSYGVRGDPFTGAPAFHAGLDFIGAYAQPIRAAAAGRVVFVGQRSGYGNVVEIDHGHGLLTRYAHLSGSDVRVGQAVARSYRIARMGSTGRSTGTHLHFEVRVNGAAVNPKRFLQLGEASDVQ